MPRKSTGQYPPDWNAIAFGIKQQANWCCVRCNHPDDKEHGYALTVHHIDLNKSNCAWWNLAALCQRCHLRIQGKVIIERPWFLQHSIWFMPYVAGYYAHINNLPEYRPYVQANLSRLIELGQGRITLFEYNVSECRLFPSHER